MYELYTPRRIEVRWMPKRPFVMANSSGEVVPVNFEPSYSIFDSESSGPVNRQDYLAHSYKVNGVCKVR